MNNPYDILHITPDAGKNETDTAYFRLLDKYESEKALAADSVSADIIQHKIDELKTAYNQIISQQNSNNILMGNAVSENINPYYSAQQNTAHVQPSVQNNFQGNAQQTQYNTDEPKINPEDKFGMVRQYIELGRYSEAENILNSINYKDTATWHFLYGKMCLGRGWMNQASVHISRASKLAPDNEEYRQEMIRINQMKIGKSSKIPVLPVVAGAACIGLGSCGYGILVSLPLICSDIE